MKYNLVSTKLRVSLPVLFDASHNVILIRSPSDLLKLLQIAAPVIPAPTTNKSFILHVIIIAASRLRSFRSLAGRLVVPGKGPVRL